MKGVCCLKILEICKPRFLSTSCLNVCRSDPHLVLWCSRRENFVSYLISTHCWSLGNQNKSFDHFKLRDYRFLLHIFIFIRDDFCERIFSKELPIWFRESVIIIEKQYFIVRIARSSHTQVFKNLLNSGELYKIHFLGIWKKYLGLVSIFLKTSEGLLLNIPQTRSSLL